MRLCSLSLRRQRLLQVLWPARLLGWMGNLCASLHVRSLQPLQALRFAGLLDRLAASLPVRPLLLPLLLPLRVALALLLPLCSRLLLLEKLECSTLLLGSMLLPMQLQDMVLYLLQVEQLLRRHTGAAWGEHSREQVGRDILQAHRDQSAHQEPKVGEAEAGRHVRPDACSDCLPAGSCSHGELKSCCLACNKFTLDCLQQGGASQGFQGTCSLVGQIRMKDIINSSLAAASGKAGDQRPGCPHAARCQLAQQQPQPGLSAAAHSRCS